MRFLASSHRLDQLTPRTRRLLLFLLSGLLLQLGTGILLHHVGPGWTPTDIALYYRGSEVTAEPDGDPLDAFGMGEPTETVDVTMHLPRSFGTLLEVAHFHLLAIPLAIFLSAHLFAMAPPGRTRWGGAIGYATLACGIVDALCPFFVRFVAGGFAWIKLGAFGGLVVGHGGMCIAVIVGVLMAGKKAAAKVESADS